MKSARLCLLLLPLSLAALAASAQQGSAPASSAAPTSGQAQSAAASQPAPVGGGRLEDSGGKPPFVFVVVGGLTHDSPETMPAFVETVKSINRVAPDLTVNMGDNVEGVRQVPKEWDTFEATAKDLAKPMFLIAGNHDMQKFPKEWIRRFKATHYDFVHKGCHFIMLSSDEPPDMGKLPEPQVQWLEDRLAAVDAKARFVFVHEGFWREGSKEMRELWASRLMPQFKKCNVKAAFAGHHAIYEMRNVDGIACYVTQGGGMHGTTGKGATPAARGGFAHVLKVAVATDYGVTVTLVGPDGKESADTIGLVDAAGKPPKSAPPSSAPAAGKPTLDRAPAQEQPD